MKKNSHAERNQWILELERTMWAQRGTAPNVSETMGHALKIIRDLTHEKHVLLARARFEVDYPEVYDVLDPHQHLVCMNDGLYTVVGTGALAE